MTPRWIPTRASEIPGGEMAGQEQLLAALETERRRLEVILRQMPAMVVVFDASGGIVRANDQYLAAIGLPADQVVGRDPRDLPLEVVDEAGQVVPTADLLSTRALLGEDATAELGIRWPSGLRWLQVLAAPIRADDGTIEGRSEERRVGKECRSRWSPDDE